jgi:hypothetical protein
VLVYRVLSGNLDYHDSGADAYHQLNRTRELCVSAQSSSASTYSIALPAKYSRILFFESGLRAGGPARHVRNRAGV